MKRIADIWTWLYFVNMINGASNTLLI